MPGISIDIREITQDQIEVPHGDFIMSLDLGLGEGRRRLMLELTAWPAVGGCAGYQDLCPLRSGCNNIRD